MMNRDGLVRLDAAAVSRRIAEHHTGTTFARALEQAAHSEQLLTIMSRFIHYCSVFGGCQASLAGEMAVRQELFRDPGEPEATADNSVEIAAGVFFGAIDEFGDRESSLTSPKRQTHRSLAQATLKGLASFYGRELATLRQQTTDHGPTRQAMARVLLGYGVNTVMDDEKIFRALGFHLATEIIADEEFCTLDRLFRQQRPDIAAFLGELQVAVGPTTLPAYFWISRHTVADAEHFAAALESANLALDYYAGAAPREQVLEWILGGVADNAAVAAEFMNAVTKD
jgi:hypothetical protein